jgi:hypothetical protein
VHRQIIIICNLLNMCDTEKKKKLQIHFVYLMELYAVCCMYCMLYAVRTVPPTFMNEPLFRNLKRPPLTFTLCNYVTYVSKLRLPNKFCLVSGRNQYQLRIAKHITIWKDRQVKLLHDDFIPASLSKYCIEMKIHSGV